MMMKHKVTKSEESPGWSLRCTMKGKSPERRMRET